MKSVVKRTVFQYFSKTGSGGVFETHSISVILECCSFLSDHVTSYGGCMYAYNCDVEIHRTSFDKCYTSAHTDETAGNAVYISQKSAVIDMISTYQCGPTSTLCSDSSIRTTSASAKVSNVNATENYGVVGSSAMALDYVIGESYIKYLQDVSGKDYISVQSTGIQYYVHYSNFINQTSHTYVCWSSTNYLLIFESCVFWNLGTVSFCNCLCSFNLCLANEDITGVTKTDVCSVNEIVFVKCNTSYGTRSRCRNSAFHIIFMVFLIVS